jgi:hypothetical protein
MTPYAASDWIDGARVERGRVRRELNKAKGSLMVVGTGIKSVSDITFGAQGWITQADMVCYSVDTPVVEIWIKQANPNSEDLTVFYRDDRKRRDTYRMMSDRILDHVRAGLDVCAVFYGHPGVFVYPAHEAIRIARQEGYRAGMLPAVSAVDCLFADLGIDPAHPGCQMFEATDYLLHHRRLNPDSHVILWQIGCVGDAGFSSEGYDAHNLPILVEELQRVYGPSHEVIHYQAARYPMSRPVIHRLPLSQLSPRMVTTASTLYIPPKETLDYDAAMARRLGLADTSEAVPGPERRVVPYQSTVDSSRLASFLMDLARDPGMLARYMRDPHVVIEQYGGLTESEQAALLSGHPGRILATMKAASQRSGGEET